MSKKRIKVFLGGYVNFLNAQNINCRALSEHLDKEKFEVWTMLHWHQNAKDFRRVPGVHYLNSRRPMRLFGWIPYFLGIVRCDVAFLPKGEYIYLCKWVGRIFNCKIFSTIEGLISGTNLEKVLRTKYGLDAYKVFLPNVYAITHAISKQVAQDLDIHTHEKVLYLGVEAANFTNQHPQEKQCLHNIVFIGNSIQYKGIEDVLSMAELFPRLKFHCVGGNQMRRGLLDVYVKEHRLNNVTYHGQLDHTQLSSLLAEMDLMYFPSRSEGFPKVMLETACAGVPTLCYGDYGADEWITTGKDGYVVYTFEEAKDVIQKLIDQPKHLQELSLNAIELGKRFDWKVLVKDWEEEIVCLAQMKNEK